MSKVNKRHFLILKLSGDLQSCYMKAVELSRKPSLSNTYLFKKDDDYYILSFSIINWLNYKKYVFESENSFKYETLNNRCGVLSFNVNNDLTEQTYIGDCIYQSEWRKNENKIIKKTIMDLITKGDYNKQNGNIADEKN